MPRAFDSDDEGAPLRFVEIVACPACGTEQHCWFGDDSLSFQDMTDPPTGTQTCDCGHTWTATATGWSFFSEAG